MALKLIEGFDAFTAPAQIYAGRKFRSANEGPSSISTGVFGGGAVNIPGNTVFHDALVCTFDPVARTEDRIVVGMRVRINDLTTVSSLQIFTELAASGVAQMGIGITQDGYPLIGGPSDPGSGAYNFVEYARSSNVFLEEGNWYYVEYEIDMANGNDVTVWVNGEVAVTYSNLPLVNVLPFNELALGSLNDGNERNPSASYDDIYVLDSSGLNNVSRLGDCRVELFVPTADVTNTFQASTEATGFEAVDEIGLDGDTSYVTADATGERLLMSSNNLLSNTPNAIFGVAINVATRKDGAGEKTLNYVLSSGGTTSIVNGRTLLDGYAMDEALYEIDPNTSLAWTRSAVEAAQFGIEVA